MPTRQIAADISDDGVVDASDVAVIGSILSAGQPTPFTDAGYRADAPIEREDEMPLTKRIIELPAPGGSVALVGTAQQAFSEGVETMHAATVMRLATEAAATGEYESIILNRAWRTIRKADGAPETATSASRISDSLERPDLILIRKDGTIDAKEVASPGQNPDQQKELLQALLDALPEGIGGNADAVPTDPAPL